MNLYHCTKLCNLSNILQHGLIPNIPQGVIEAEQGIYLSKNPFEWMWWVTNKGTVPGALLEIDVTGLKIIDRFGLLENDCLHPEYICKESISPERFVCVSVENKPGHFDKYPILQKTI